MTAAKTWSVRAIRVGKASVAIGAALGAMAACQTFVTPDQPDIAGIASGLDGRTSQVCAFATQFVAAYLPATTTDRLKLGQYVTLPNNVQLPKTPALLVDMAGCYTAKPKTTAGDAQVWVVFVSTLQRTYPGAPPERGFYQVNVTLDSDIPRALDVPAARNPPGPGVDVQTAYQNAIPPNTPLYSLVSGFVAAYLTGTPALDRYITGDSGLSVVGGYQSATVTAITAAGRLADTPSDGVTAHLLATVNARTISPDVAVTYSYPLELQAASGTWMVAGIDTTPQINPHTKPAQPQEPK